MRPSKQVFLVMSAERSQRVSFGGAPLDEQGYDEGLGPSWKKPVFFSSPTSNKKILWVTGCLRATSDNDKSSGGGVQRSLYALLLVTPVVRHQRK